MTDSDITGGSGTGSSGAEYGYAQTPATLNAQVRMLNDEISQLRRRLAVAPMDTRPLERQLSESSTRINALTERNEKLVITLREARSQLLQLKEEVDRLAQPPSGYGVFLGAGPEGTVEVFTSGRRMRLTVSPSVEVPTLRRGQQVRLNEALTVVEAGEFELVGEVSSLRELLDDGRALVVGHADEERVVHLASPLLDLPLKPGDSLLVDTKAGYAYERVPKSEVEDLVLEEVPDVEYGDIGGLTRQIEQIRDAVELPFLHAELFREFKLRPPKGVLLYGPPGCGKTLIAKAVANSLAKKVAAARGVEHVTSYFLNIKGPELLNKYVGETERTIRLIFQRAREKASDGTPVIVFFDEMDSVFRTRGTGVSSDVETTIVPQLLSEIDGVEGLENVIVIGASNREDMIDPAILRPGRLDVKIKIERPDAEAATDIFAKYLVPELPIHPDDLAEFGGDRGATITAMIQHTVERMYAETDENRFLEVTYANGDKEVLYFKDFNSGAMIQNIVDRAKKSAIKERIEKRGAIGSGGLRVTNLLDAIVDEFAENEDLPNTTNPGRLGTYLRQEGGADRLHPHPGFGQAVRRIACHRHRLEHRAVPLVQPRSKPPEQHRAVPLERQYLWNVSTSGTRCVQLRRWPRLSSRGHRSCSGVSALWVVSVGQLVRRR